MKNTTLSQCEHLARAGKMLTLHEGHPDLRRSLLAGRKF